MGTRTELVPFLEKGTERNEVPQNSERDPSLLKTAFTFIPRQHSLAQGGRERSALKQKERRKYKLFQSYAALSVFFYLS